MDTIELLTERVHLFELINDASIDGIMVFDTELTAIYWNTAIEQISGISRDSAAGQQLYELFPHCLGQEAVADAIKHVLKGRKVFLPCESVSYYGKGYYEQHFVPLKGEHGAVIGILCIVHDIAHRIKAEEELKALNKSLVRKNRELKSKNDELSSFSQVTSNDLKDPLHKIYSFVEMIISKEAENLSDNARSYLKRIQGSAQRMRLLTDDLLDYQQICTLKPDMRPADLHQVLMMAVHTLSVADDKVKDYISISGKLPVLRGDHYALMVMLQHILDNGIKFRKPGHTPQLAIVTGIVPGTDIPNPDAAKELNYFRISISDNGIGFDKKYTEQIFQIFFRVSSQYRGTGIGLPVCKKVAELHGGFITAESVEDQGSTFHVFIPANRIVGGHLA